MRGMSPGPKLIGVKPFTRRCKTISMPNENRSGATPKKNRPADTFFIIDRPGPQGVREDIHGRKLKVKNEKLKIRN